MTTGRFGGLLLKFPNIISKTWTKSNNNGGKPSSWRRWITWSSPWTISWLLASWAAAPESTGYRTAPCPPFPGPQHSQSQSSCWQSAAPAGSRWTGPDPVCFGSKHHGNCTGSWEEEGEGRIRVNLAFFYIPNFPRVLQPVQSWEQLSQHPGQCCVHENSDILLSLSLSRGENMHSSQLEHKPTIPVNKNLKCLKFNSFLKGIVAVRVLLSVLSTCSHILPAHYVTYITTMETFNTIKTLQRVCWKSFF